MYLTRCVVVSAVRGSCGCAPSCSPEAVSTWLCLEVLFVGSGYLFFPGWVVLFGCREHFGPSACFEWSGLMLWLSVPHCTSRDLTSLQTCRLRENLSSSVVRHFWCVLHPLRWVLQTLSRYFEGSYLFLSRRQLWG